MADSSPMEIQYPIELHVGYLNEVFLGTCMYHKQMRLKSFLYHVLLARALHRFIDEWDQRVCFCHLWSRTTFKLRWTDLFWVLMHFYLLEKLNFRTCIDLQSMTLWLVLYLKVYNDLSDTIVIYENAKCYGPIRIKYSK